MESVEDDEQPCYPREHLKDQLVECKECKECKETGKIHDLEEYCNKLEEQLQESRIAKEKAEKDLLEVLLRVWGN